jgi:hypothetical protein
MTKSDKYSRTCEEWMADGREKYWNGRAVDAERLKMMMMMMMMMIDHLLIKIQTR